VGAGVIQPVEGDIGRHVTYRTRFAVEHGRITSFNQKVVFVRYYERIEDGHHSPRYGETSEATRREDLEWS